MPQYVYEPWYLRRRAPIFCGPCIPVYTSVYSTRKLLLVIGCILWCLGFVVLLGLLLTCIAVSCGAIVAALLPVAFILLIVGLLLFHCGWAAHLLDEDGQLPSSVTGTQETMETRMEKREKAPLFESASNCPEVEQGFWQFKENDAWQNRSSRDQLQQTVIYNYKM